MFTKLKSTLKNLLTQKAIILMYHQVCERVSDPWELAVSPENFDAQLGFIKKNFEVVSLEELASGVGRKNIGGRKLAITFDDGFSDNYTNARPILEAHQLPATFYVATQPVISDQLYWWDELEMIILHGEQLPRSLEITIGDHALSFQFITDDVLTRHLTEEISGWNAGKPTVNERVALFFQLWQKIQPLPHHEQRSVLAKIRQWAGVSHVANKNASVMGLNEMKSLGSNPLFTIGAHTVNHAMLAHQEVETQAFEVQESKKVIENWLGRKVTGFAYPYGNYNATTKLLLRDAGFRYAVSTESRAVTNKDDLYELPRIQVKNWDVKTFANNIRQILSHETK